MKVFIITMEDPVQTIPFIKKVIKARKEWMVGVSVAKGDRLTIRKKQSKWLYLFSLLLIMGPFHFLKNSFITLRYKLYKVLSCFLPGLQNHILTGWLAANNIPVKKINTANAPDFLAYLKTLKPDVIINQSQSILRSELLNIPKLGVINRHNALLPKNRGRLTPFWVLYKGETETGISIHFVTQKLDAGDIIVQKRFPVQNDDTFNTLVKKNYALAPKAMIEALDKLADGVTDFIPNNDAEATYNSTPGLKEAFEYWKRKKPHPKFGKAPD